MQRMPVAFVGHGNPMNVLGTGWSKKWRQLGEALPRPRAIVAVSAHWFTRGTYVMGNAQPETIHDFGGFPPELYEMQYPAPGDPQLAGRLQEMLSPWKASIRDDWGLDHGTWTVTKHTHPDAEVPVVQLSIDAHAPAQDHWEIGQALAPLRDDGVLILASGNLVHNLGTAFPKWRAGDTSTASWSQDFDERVARALEHGDQTTLVGALSDDLGKQAHPTPDHYLPILYAAGAAEDAEVSFPIDGFDMGDISMRSVLFD